MRAVEDSLNPATFAGYIAIHLRVDMRENPAVERSARDAGLVCRYHKMKLRRSQSSYGAQAAVYRLPLIDGAYAGRSPLVYNAIATQNHQARYRRPARRYAWLNRHDRSATCMKSPRSRLSWARRLRRTNASSLITST